MKKYFVQTFGCQMNQADSEKITMVLLQSGFAKAKELLEADLVIFNTCSVRQKGEDRVFGMLTEIKKENEKREKNGRNDFIKAGVTGCMVRKTGLAERYLSEKKERKKAKKIELLESSNDILNTDDKLFPRSREIDFTLRIEETKYLPLILTKITGEKIGQDDKFDDYLKQKQYRNTSYSGNVIIQTGCDNYCTFCIVPYTRGKEISREPAEIIEEVKNLAKSGVKEITLLGQNVNSYGKQFIERKLWNEEKSKWNDFSIGSENFKSPFRKLLEDISEISGIERVRFTSSNPHDMTKDILDSHFDLKNTCNYLHFALQSGSNQMLKKMNRKHTYEDFKKQVEYLRSKDPFFSISTDIIVGYSGETEEMFEETLKAFDELVFDFAYIARYSVRPGTIAAKMFQDDVPNSVKAERWHRLNNKLLENIKKRAEIMIGSTQKVLITGQKDEKAFGRTTNFKEVFFPNEIYKEGDIVEVEILDLDKWVFQGNLV